MASFTKSDKRTHYCGTLTKADIGERVTVLGWCQKQRDLGSLIFIDLRDRTGMVQLAFDSDTDKQIFDDAFGVRAEYVLSASGIVRSRGEGAVNPNMATGEVEIAVDAFKILASAQTPPFAIVENSDVKPELRLTHRYLDLRRPDLQGNIIARSKIVKIARDYYDDNGFIDIETPNLIKPTPEGARDYLVPSRVHPGKFYALPQSPQLYKQLLMYAGFDRYFQIARCYRDEDLRADRQPEFTQIDLEMSFADEDDIIAMNEGFIKRLFDEFMGLPLETPFPRMTYAEAMDRYGSDKPDTRFEIPTLSATVVSVYSQVLLRTAAVFAVSPLKAVRPCPVRRSTLSLISLRLTVLRVSLGTRMQQVPFLHPLLSSSQKRKQQRSFLRWVQVRATLSLSLLTRTLLYSTHSARSVYTLQRR